MPAVISPEHWATWLGEEPASADELKALLVPFEGTWTMRAEKPIRAKKSDTSDSQPTLF
jgi:putative SOS response-associated peptidase YedK